MCGGTAVFSRVAGFSLGLSPRVRGNLSWRWWCGGCGRSIPACAGEPNPLSVVSDAYWVYPRVCGGTAAITRADSPPAGLSPRVRGNLVFGRRAGQREGSIPACAGEPVRRVRDCGPLSVYPRVCGGTVPGLLLNCAGWGLSPRVRGNRANRVTLAHLAWSIPACAGEPAFRRPGTG